MGAGRAEIATSAAKGDVENVAPAMTIPIRIGTAFRRIVAPRLLDPLRTRHPPPLLIFYTVTDGLVHCAGKTEDLVFAQPHIRAGQPRELRFKQAKGLVAL